MLPTSGFPPEGIAMGRKWCPINAHVPDEVKQHFSRSRSDLPPRHQCREDLVEEYKAHADNMEWDKHSGYHQRKAIALCLFSLAFPPPAAFTNLWRDLQDIN